MVEYCEFISLGIETDSVSPVPNCHFIAKNSQNQIFATGNNAFGQLGTGDTKDFLQNQSNNYLNPYMILF